MAAGIHAMTPLPTTTHQPNAALRRATYVHVSDLTSAYNIDHARLDQELARVKAERDVGTETKAVIELPESEEDVTQASDLDASLVNIPQKRLQPPRGGYNLCVLVGKVNVVVDKRRVDRSRVRLAEVEIGDETGTVSLRARDDQIDVLEDVAKRGGAVVLRNCTLELYQGKHIRLAVTKWGKLCTYPDAVASTPPPPSKMNVDRNFSLIDLSVVASEMVDPNPEPSYNPRPSKPPEAGDGGGTGGGRAVGGKQGGSTHRQQGQQYQQAQPSTRRGSRGGDRRQGRNKQSGGGGGGGGGNPAQPHYGGGSPSTEGTPMQQLPGQMRYQSMHGYTPGYDQAMDARQYSYPHSRQQEVSAQQMMLHQHQQYEMHQMQQQRQMQHMYHGQQDRHSSMRQGHQMQPAPMLATTVAGSGSFDGTGDYSVSSYVGSEQHQSVMAVVGSNPVLMPMGMPAAARSPSGMSSPPSVASPREQYGGPHRMMMPVTMSASPMESGRHEHQRKNDGPQHSQQPDGSFGIDRHHPHSHSQGMDSAFAAGKMNPQASVFAPSYMSPTANPQGTHQLYYPLNPSQGATGPMYRQGSEQYPLVYGSGTGFMYGASDTGSTKPPMGTEEAARDPPRSGPASSEAGSDSPASGKENVQSGS